MPKKSYPPALEVRVKITAAILRETEIHTQGKQK